MGCYIHTEIDLNKNGVWHRNVEVYTSFEAFPDAGPPLFDFFANVKSSGAPAIAARRGLTKDRMDAIDSYFKQMSDEQSMKIAWNNVPHLYLFYHNKSWVLLSELLSYNYDIKFVHFDLQEEISLREYLGREYFENLKRIRNRYREYSPEEIRFFFYFEN
ncbi:hypothetical protein [Fluoribacter gormanii]|uniref:hypothetical protein n=1 Tax=Fluoribacter gormanii TaxID=464 RepID=UPI00104193F1|nr:hypothetical protein [Fluoribacter gormanii]